MPRIVAALMSKGADLCQGLTVFESTVALSIFTSLGMFKCALLQKSGAPSVGARDRG
jgi:hypothetical protein